VLFFTSPSGSSKPASSSGKRPATPEAPVRVGVGVGSVMLQGHF
jgi:hypothetical protein